MMDRCLWQPLPGKFLTTETPPPTTQSTCRIVTFWLVHPNKGAFKYYVIALGGVGGPASIADADDALRGVGGQEPK